MVPFGVEFVPPQDFGTKEWWEAERPGARWFYHSPRYFHAPAKGVDLSTVDADLVDVVVGLHRLGLTTGPSCAGHAVEAPYTQQLYRALKLDEALVRDRGLTLRNVESGDRVLWARPSYRLPWADWNMLHGHLEMHALVGLLPITGPDGVLRRLAANVSRVPGIELELMPGWLRLWVCRDSLSAQQATWRRVAEVVHDEAART